MLQHVAGCRRSNVALLFSALIKPKMQRKRGLTRNVLQCVAVCCKVLSFKCDVHHASTGQAKRQRKCLHGGYGVRSRDSMKHNEQHVDTLPWVSFMLWIQAREAVTKSSTQCATRRYAGCRISGGYKRGKLSLQAAHTATHTATHNTHTPCGQFIWWIQAREAETNCNTHCNTYCNSCCNTLHKTHAHSLWAVYLVDTGAGSRD